jgi:hypothetical protein
MPAPYSGGCQCGAVRYEIGSEPDAAYVCHCTDCQRQSGSAFAMAIRIPEQHFRLLRGKLRKWVRPTANGHTMDCLFCSKCGTRICHVADRFPTYRSVKPGTLDDQRWVKPTHHLFLRSKLPWVRIPDGVVTADAMTADRSWLAAEKVKPME